MTILKIVKRAPDVIFLKIDKAALLRRESFAGRIWVERGPENSFAFGYAKSGQVICEADISHSDANAMLAAGVYLRSTHAVLMRFATAEPHLPRYLGPDGYCCQLSNLSVVCNPQVTGVVLIQANKCDTCKPYLLVFGDGGWTTCTTELTEAEAAQLRDNGVQFMEGEK
jgi:hypothetical protein